MFNKNLKVSGEILPLSMEIWKRKTDFRNNNNLLMTFLKGYFTDRDNFFFFDPTKNSTLPEIVITYYVLKGICACLCMYLCLFVST